MDLFKETRRWCSRHHWKNQRSHHQDNYQVRWTTTKIRIDLFLLIVPMRTSTFWRKRMFVENFVFMNYSVSMSFSMNSVNRTLSKWTFHPGRKINHRPTTMMFTFIFSLHSNSPLDISVKGSMISDLLNLSGFMIPDRRDLIIEGSARR